MVVMAAKQTLRAYGSDEPRPEPKMWHVSAAFFVPDVCTLGQIWGPLAGRGGVPVGALRNRSGTGVKFNEALYGIMIFGVGTVWNRSGTGLKFDEALCNLHISIFRNRSEPFGIGPEPE